MTTCLVLSCDRPVKSLGWCGAHHQRWLKHGDPERGGPIRVWGSPEDRFFSRVTRDPDNPAACWISTGADNGAGYSVFQVDGRQVYMHRWSYQHFIGPIPAGLQLDHLCRTTRCVNPAHLEPVTCGENIRRAAVRYKSITHCKRGHEFTPENTRVGSSGSRNCLECQRLRGRALYRSQRAAERAAAS